jgi:signal transduction histidine kinase
MKRSRWNERTRMLVLMLAVVVPAAALIGFGVMHLKSIQRDRAVEAAIQREYQQMLVISEKRINERAYELAGEVRRGLPARPDADSLDRFLAAHPYAAHVFFYEHGKGLVFRSQPDRMRETDFRKESDELSKMASTWFPLEAKGMVAKMHKMEKNTGKPFYFFTNWVPRGEQRGYQVVGLFPLAGAPPERIAFGGFAFDAEYLKKKFFPPILDALVPCPPAPAGEKAADNHAVIMVHVARDPAPLAASTEWDGGLPEVERNFESVFYGLTLAIKVRGTTVAAMGARFLRTSYLILGCLSVLMAGGIYLTYRSVSKEVALAKLKSDFVSNVSHELRTPLSLIRLYAETLEMGRLQNPEKYQEYYCIIRKESERLTALINNILDFSRIEAGRKEYDMRETDLAGLVRNTLDAYRFQIEQNGFQFQQNIAEDLPPVRVDREAIARSLLNLVNNAVKYSSHDKYLGVNVYRQNGWVKLEVIDHGIGIPRGELHKIFEKFYRAGDPLVHNTKGSGLGLSLVRHIVQAHGGNVAVESAPGKGSKFTMTLPAAGNGRAREEAKVASAAS